MPDAVVLLVQTRWHEDDLAGRILASPSASEWTVLSLPGSAEEHDPLGRVEGAALWPHWYPAERLHALRAEIGERAFLALYQQRPTSERGGIFRREWMSGRYGELPRGPTTTIQTVDSAFKTGVANDYSVIATWTTDGRFFYLVDVWRQRVEFPDLVAAIQAQAAAHGPSAVAVEDTASAQSAIQVLRRETALPIVPVPAAGSAKISRAGAVSPLFESGRVLLPEQSPGWLGPWIEEHVGFPTARHGSGPLRRSAAFSSQAALPPSAFVLSAPSSATAASACISPLDSRCPISRVRRSSAWRLTISAQCFTFAAAGTTAASSAIRAPPPTDSSSPRRARWSARLIASTGTPLALRSRAAW